MRLAATLFWAVLLTLQSAGGHAANLRARKCRRLLVPRHPGMAWTSGVVGLDLHELDFTGADLSSTDLSDVDLRGAKLVAAELRRCSIAREPD